MLPTLLFDRSDRVRVELSGPHAIASLNGLVTNNVVPLAPGQGQYAAILTAKGKVVADLRVFRTETGVLIDTSAAAAPGLRATLAKYVNPRFATVTDVSETLHVLGVYGDDSAEIVAKATGADLAMLGTLPVFGHLIIQNLHADSGDDGAQAGHSKSRADEAIVAAASPEGLPVPPTIRIARVPDLAVAGYELFAQPSQITGLRDRLLHAGAVERDAEAWRGLRVAIGWPEWGVDMTEDTIAQEANLDALGGISFDKGCYVGQETVARIHFRGHVNRTLRRLGFSGELPSVGAELVDGDGKVVGDVRSVARLATGRAVGIGMVRREVETGAVLTTSPSSEPSAPTEVLGAATGNEKGAID